MGYHQLTQKNDLFPILVDYFLESNEFMFMYPNIWQLLKPVFGSPVFI